MNTAPITLTQLWRYRAPQGSAAARHQDAALLQLEEQLQAGRPYSEVMRRCEPWFKAWSQGGRQPMVPCSSGRPFLDVVAPAGSTAYRVCAAGACRLFTIGSEAFQYFRQALIEHGLEVPE